MRMQVSRGWYGGKGLSGPERGHAPRASEVVREASAGEADCDLRVYTDGSADGRDEWAGSYSTDAGSDREVGVSASPNHHEENMRTREVRLEVLSVLAVVGKAVTSSNTIVTAREHDAAAACAELREEVADRGRVVEGNLRYRVSQTRSSVWISAILLTVCSSSP